MSKPNLTPSLFCIGNVMVDFFAAADAEFARRYGIDGPVQHIEHSRLMAAIGELPDKVPCSGGGAANVAKIAALLGTGVRFTGARGTDEPGRFFEKELGEAGVCLTLLPRKTPTGCCLILKLEDTVRIAAAPAASLELGVEDIDEEDIRSAAVVVIDGYLMNRQDLVRHILEKANHYGTMVALDLSSVPIARERAHEILTYSRVYPLILFMNEEEAGAFFRTISSQDGVESDGEEEIGKEMAGFFQGLTANELFPIVVIKRGKRGATVFAGGRSHRESAFTVNPRDSTGAGDAFCAAFLSAWIRGKTLGECAALGNKVAREVLAAPGATVNRKRIAALGKPLGKV
ncbi:MAG: PfkB family carbohydrate kinase [Treponema sp.]|jgi:sugar/nucleoside kinase (ribokinase family)|nr:PfkB family carbohydrate kinase [Treponema sp.]